MEIKVPQCRHNIGKEEIDALTDVLKTRWITTGPKTQEFEEKFAEYIGTNHAIATSSCTASLHISTHKIKDKFNNYGCVTARIRNCL